MPPKPVVVLVEDNKDTRDLYAESLAFCGFHVHATGDADDAFRLAVQHRPHVVVTDFVLPGGPSGAELCNRLKKDRRTSRIPTLLVTASSQRKDVEAALKQGCAVVRMKPYLPDELERDIRLLIAGKRVTPWPPEHRHPN